MPDAAYLRLENRHTGEVLLLCRRRLDGDVGLELRGSLPPQREGPPMHVHYVEEEQGRVTAGRLSVEVDGRRIEAGPGEIVRFPKGVPPLFYLAHLALRHRSDWPGCPSRCTGAPFAIVGSAS